MPRPVRASVVRHGFVLALAIGGVGFGVFFVVFDVDNAVVVSP